jgi:hypothetical protein
MFEQSERRAFLARCGLESLIVKGFVREGGHHVSTPFGSDHLTPGFQVRFFRARIKQEARSRASFKKAAEALTTKS